MVDRRGSASSAVGACSSAWAQQGVMVQHDASVTRLYLLTIGELVERLLRQARHGDER